jgi:hypothetical protein
LKVVTIFLRRRVRNAGRVPAQGPKVLTTLAAPHFPHFPNREIPAVGNRAFKSHTYNSFSIKSHQYLLVLCPPPFESRSDESRYESHRNRSWSVEELCPLPTEYSSVTFCNHPRPTRAVKGLARRRHGPGYRSVTRDQLRTEDRTCQLATRSQIICSDADMLHACDPQDSLRCIDAIQHIQVRSGPPRCGNVRP